MLPELVERLLMRGLATARLEADGILAALRRTGVVGEAEADELRRAVDAAVSRTGDAFASDGSLDGPRARPAADAGAGPDVLAAIVARLSAIEARLAALERAVAAGVPGER